MSPVALCASHLSRGLCVCLCFVVYYFVSFLVLYHFEEEERELVALLLLSLGCLVAVDILCLFLAVPWVGLGCVIVVFPYHTPLLL